MKVTLKLFAFRHRKLSSYSGEGMTYLTNTIPNLVDQNVIFKYVFKMLSNMLRLTSHLNDHSIVSKVYNRHYVQSTHARLIKRGSPSQLFICDSNFLSCL